MISIIYCTNRAEPKFDWFINSLFNQTNEEERKNIEVIFISYSDESFLHYDNVIAKEYYLNDFKIIQSHPKPNVYQGEKRKTTAEYFSPANARNTGFILSSGDYIVFIDDVSVLMPGWWSAVKKQAEAMHIVCGAYQKHYEMSVENGIIKSSRPHRVGIDSRWGLANGSPVKISGAQFFGCSFGIPAKDFIQINGFDELCDSIGGEDYQFGLRLSNAGKTIWYDKNIYTVESEELHNQPYLMKREDRVMTPPAYLARLADFNMSKRHTSGNFDSSHMILDLLYGKKQTWTLGNNYTISDCRKTKTFPEVENVNEHWFDKKPLIEMA